MLAAVTAGLVMSFYAGGRISPGVEHSMHTFWSMATYVANTVIFFVSGLIIGDRAVFDPAIGVRERRVKQRRTKNFGSVLLLCLIAVACTYLFVFLTSRVTT